MFEDEVPLLRKANIRPSVLLNITKEKAACQHWHQDTRSSKILNIIIALEPGYFIDVLIGDEPYRVNLNVGEVICFLDLVHRGTEAMGIRMHIRVELEERGLSAEVNDQIYFVLFFFQISNLLILI